ncbi:MAG: hypothetical protein KDD55_00635 [Bdellovibrionales bacterium]|nr:hypothetical protein [Bdellovibrionales bacterium]
MSRSGEIMKDVPELVPLSVIGKKREPQSLFCALCQGPFVHLFFAVAILAGLVGISYLGIHLWLMRVGLMEMRPSFLSFRALHAEIQLFLFFGFFVLGFIAQASPKLLQVDRRMSPWCMLSLIFAPSGLLLEHVFSFPVIGKLLLSGSFLLILLCLIPLALGGSTERRWPVGGLFSIGLLSFSIGVWLPIERTEVSLLVFWAALLPSVLAASQQFLSGLFGGRFLRFRQLLLVIVLYFCSVFSLIKMAYPFELFDSPMDVFALSALLLVVVFLRVTKVNIRRATGFVRLTFLFALTWSLVGPILIIFHLLAADAILHLYALGVGFTLLLGVSLQILNHLSGRELLSRRVSLLFLCVWQLVPLLRCFSWWSNPHLCLFGTSVISFIHLIWSYVVLKASWRIGVRALTLRKGESLVQC